MNAVKNVFLSNEPLEVSEIAATVRDVRFGGVVTFTGEVRAITGDTDTTALEYEAHPTMALVQMSRIADEAASRWEANVAIAHRLGRLEPGEVSVVCVAACAHRAQAFECCRYLIDEIKRDVPIWKREFGSGGEAWVSA